MKNFVQPGDNLTLIAPAAIASGEALLIGAIFGVANAAAESGKPVVISTVGVFDLPKAAGALTQGQVVYWDATAENVTGTATDNTRIGVAVAAEGSASTKVNVRLNGTF